MPERETKEFTTPGGHKVVMRTYLTGREANELKAIMFAALKVNMDDAQTGKIGVGEIPSSFLIEQEQKAMSLLVVSVDGDADSPVEKLLDMPSGEYAAVVQEINQIQNPTSRGSSAQTGSGTSDPAL